WGRAVAFCVPKVYRMSNEDKEAAFYRKSKVVLCCMALALAAVCTRGTDVSVANFPRQPTETDDAPRIARAIGAVGTGGGQVFFPSGSYVLATTNYYSRRYHHVVLQSQTNLTLRGAGPSSVLQTALANQSGAYNGKDAILIGIYGSSGIAIRDLSF